MIDFKKLLEDCRNKSPEEREAERERRYQRISADIRTKEDNRNRHIFRLAEDARLNKWEQDFVAQMVPRAQRNIQNRERTGWVPDEFTDRMEDKIREIAERYPEALACVLADEVRYAGRPETAEPLPGAEPDARRTDDLKAE